MQNDYILIPWDTVHKVNSWYTEHIDNINTTELIDDVEYGNNALNVYIDYAFIILFVYSVIIASFLFLKK